MEVHLGDLFELLEQTFDFLLIVDGDGRIIHASPLVLRECGIGRSAAAALDLDALRSGSNSETWDTRVEAIREAMGRARAGKSGRLVFSSHDDPGASFTISCGASATERGDLYIFYGTKIAGLSAYAEWEKEERIKELSCIYSIAEWIEDSATVTEFFSELPKYIAPGMHYPERVMVYSVYQGAEYGEKPISSEFLRIDLVVRNQKRGEIRVGYDSDFYDYLPEEQKMLDEIGRMLTVALERKEYRDTLTRKVGEEAEFRRRLRELEEEIAARTEELEAQRERLAAVDAYLANVTRGFEESTKRLETILRAIPDKAAIIDRRRNVVLTNRENVAAGEKCYKTFFNSDVPCPDCRLSKIIADKLPIVMEMKHGDEYFEVHALPIFSEQNEVEGIFEFYRDITRQKHYETQLQQADKLASLGQLVSGVGHEINNPNQFIRGNIKIIEQALKDILPIVDAHYEKNPDLKIARLKYPFFREHIMTLVSDMAHGSERIKGIVEGLKGFARRDEGLLIDMVDVNTVIDASARLVHTQVHKFADIELDLAPELPVLTGNAQKLEQVMINLIMNAAQAMPDDRRGVIRVSTRAEGGNVVIKVADNGKGMSERTLKNIFDPFFTTRRAKGGTGLGLPIVFRIVEEHGGTINVASKVDEGTTFTVTLPVGKKAADAVSVPAQSQAETGARASEGGAA
ncbi:MAG: GHKL domain-containing protein [bacterium]|jgi:signal transduction histidine kinase